MENIKYDSLVFIMPSPNYMWMIADNYRHPLSLAARSVMTDFDNPLISSEHASNSYIWLANQVMCLEN